MAYSLRSMKTLGRRGFYSSPSSADFRPGTGGDSGFHMLRFYLGNLGSAFIVYALYQRQCRDPDEQPCEVTLLILPSLMEKQTDVLRAAG